MTRKWRHSSRGGPTVPFVWAIEHQLNKSAEVLVRQTITKSIHFMHL